VSNITFHTFKSQLNEVILSQTTFDDVVRKQGHELLFGNEMNRLKFRQHICVAYQRYVPFLLGHTDNVACL
jgi:ABC-type phosphate transport system ATPase subunit